ncbi:MAG: GNAT family N-acetyltransferase [Methanobacteriota archaeon]|nr:MAG: GNAT family N-acetyltransferase [Euryarchaeota archaeon]
MAGFPSALEAFIPREGLPTAMPGLELAPLETSDAEEYWRVFLAGRTDVPTRDLRVHIDRYLALPQDEQKTYFAVKENGRIIGTVRLAGNFLGTFSLLPEERRWTQDAILVALEPLIQSGPERVVASYEDAYSTEFERLGFLERFSRIRMEAPVRTTPPPAVPMAHPEVTDLEDVMRFLMGVYEGHIEQKFGMHVGSETEWREYVTGIWKGDSGSYLPLASWAARDSDGVAGVALTTHWMGAPLLSELGVRKDRRGEGLGRALVVQTMNALADLTYDRLGLYVTIGNDPALALYKSLGFTQVGGRAVSAVREL